MYSVCSGLTDVQCVYWSDTTIFIGSIYSIFYIRYNYMFQRLIMAIFRLYMKYLLSSHTKYVWAVYMGYIIYFVLQCNYTAHTDTI